MIGANLLWSGRLDLTLPYFEQSCATIRDLLGPDHLEMIRPPHDLGDILRQRGNEAAGIPLLEHAVEMADRELPREHWLATAVLRTLGEACLIAGRVDEARPLLERRLAGLDRGAMGGPVGVRDGHGRVPLE